MQFFVVSGKRNLFVIFQTDITNNIGSLYPYLLCNKWDFQQIFPLQNIGVWGSHPVNCEWLACMGVYWEFVIFTIQKYPNGSPLAMFTNFGIRPLKCSFSCGFIKILSQRYFCTLSSFIFLSFKRFFQCTALGKSRYYNSP